MNFLGRIRILPLLAVIAAMSFGMRFGDFVKQVTSAPPVQAQEVAEMDDMAPMEEKVAEVTDGGAVDYTDPPLMDEDVSKWRDSQDTDFEYSDVQMELFEDLSQRRKDLDGKERELEMREALLKAAQQEMEQKFKELSSLRSEIQGLLVEQSDEEKQRITSLVKIYEGMKAKDAARIFNTLDLDVLMQVVTEMSERKSAPIIAAMQADRARTVTVMLAEQKRLPEITEEFFE
ncbi:MAG: flagellar protein FlbB [Alphaproteobacteria bacterium]|nr:flagellar protein FlbB [Alphaproteobacteria bacterium]